VGSEILNVLYRTTESKRDINKNEPERRGVISGYATHLPVLNWLLLSVLSVLTDSTDAWHHDIKTVL